MVIFMKKLLIIASVLLLQNIYALADGYPKSEEMQESVPTDKLNQIYSSGYDTGKEIASGQKSDTPKLLPTSPDEQDKWTMGIRDGWRTANADRQPLIYVSAFNIGKESKTNNYASLNALILKNQEEVNIWNRGVQEGWNTTTSDPIQNQITKYCFNPAGQKFNLGDIYQDATSVLVCAKNQEQPVWVTVDTLKSNM